MQLTRPYDALASVTGEGRARRSACGVAAASISIAIILVSPLVIRYKGPNWFLHLGHEFPPSIELAQRLLGRNVVVPHKEGHDGRESWVLARDPLLIDGKADAHNLDRPAYRSQRILYSALAAPWRLLGEEGLVWGLLMTNLAVVGFGAYQTSRLAMEVGAPARAGLAFVLAPSIVVAVLGDLSDALAFALLMMTLRYVLQHRMGPAIACLAAAALSREAVLLSIASIAVLNPTGLARRTRLLLVGIPSAVFGIWMFYARWRLGSPPSQIKELAMPFIGYLRAWIDGWSFAHNYDDAVCALALLPIALLIVLLWRRRPNLLTAAALPWALLVPFLSAQVLDVKLNSLRALGPAITLIVITLYMPANSVATETSPV